MSTRPPPSSPSAEERERAALAGWLTRDLTPKHSLRPSVVPPEPAAAAPMASVSVGVVAASLTPPPQDSLTPQLLPPGMVPSDAPPARELDEDDLSVLPGRRRKAAPGSRRKRAALALAAVLLLVAAALTRRGGGPASNFEGAANAAADTSAALPPPPPAEAAPTPDEPAPVMTPAPRRGASGATNPDPGPVDPRSFLGGLAVRRYADVPSPTLSRLAREQRARARARDDAVRGSQSEAGSSAK